MRIFVTAIMALFIVAGTASASEDKALTKEEASRFVASLEAVEAVGKELEADGETDTINFDMQPKAGEEFRPYSKSIAALKKASPSHHGRLSKAVKPHGFTPKRWGEVGDRVIMAYLSVKMEEDNPGAMAQLKAMDKSMLDMMPASARGQFLSMMVMMEAVENAPAEDKKVVNEIRPELDEYFEENSKS